MLNVCRIKFQDDFANDELNIKVDLNVKNDLSSLHFSLFFLYDL